MSLKIIYIRWEYLEPYSKQTIIISVFWEFFTLSLADGFQLKSEWQQVP